MITITNKKQCSGCSACATACPIQCITMTEDKEGFLYPQVNKELCIKCKKCITVCPVINPFPKRTPQQCHAAYHVKTREVSSSGGIFYWIACYILQQKGVVAELYLTRTGQQNINSLIKYQICGCCKEVNTFKVI